MSPLALFTGNLAAEAGTLALIALLVLLITAICVVIFVDRFVRRPVARLESGVARIAAGDYGTDVAVVGRDELARLATSVNRMRSEIQENVAEIERARAKLDAAVDRLGGVSRALTTTTAGIAGLEAAVVHAAAAIVGTDSAAAVLLHRDGQSLVATATVGVDGEADLAAWGVVEELLGGRAVCSEGAPLGWSAGGLLAVPMFYQDDLVGALGVLTGPEVLPNPSDEASLACLPTTLLSPWRTRACSSRSARRCAASVSSTA